MRIYTVNQASFGLKPPLLQTGRWKGKIRKEKSTVCRPWKNHWRKEWKTPAWTQNSGLGCLKQYA